MKANPSETSAQNSGISNSTYLFIIQSGFSNIHSTSIQTTDPPASAGNSAGKVKKKKRKK